MTQQTAPQLRPMKDALANILMAEPEPISEFALIRKLQAKPYELLSTQALQGNLSLFQTHFLVFHCLYSLREHWREEGFCDLRIEPLAIGIEPLPESVGPQVAKLDSLALYYLDFSHFSATTDVDIEALLNSFWQQFVNPCQAVSADERSQAMLIMGLQTMPESTQQLKREYRQQVHHHHPDKGGSSDAMHTLQWAYKILQQALQAGVYS